MYNYDGMKAAFKGMPKPREGLLHSTVRGIKEWTIGDENRGFVFSGSQKVKYGGTAFSPGGWREIMSEVESHPTIPGAFRMGARKSIGKSLLGFGGKVLSPALFAMTAYKEGIGKATEDFIIGGAMWGAGKWAFSRLLMAAPPLLLGGAVLGGAYMAKKALQAGRNYNKAVRKVSFGNAFNDTYGTAATMRQASIAAIQGSKINGRSALGSEAQLLHA